MAILAPPAILVVRDILVIPGIRDTAQLDIQDLPDILGTLGRLEILGIRAIPVIRAVLGVPGTPAQMVCRETSGRLGIPAILDILATPAPLALPQPPAQRDILAIPDIRDMALPGTRVRPVIPDILGLLDILD
jgi:hypothetical protein